MPGLLGELNSALLPSVPGLRRQTRQLDEKLYNISHMFENCQRNISVLSDELMFLPCSGGSSDPADFVSNLIQDRQNPALLVLCGCATDAFDRKA